MSNDACDLLCLDLPLAESLRGHLPTTAEVEGAAAEAKALGDPTRLSLMAVLGRTEELCVCDLSWISSRSENLVSHHLRLLRTAGLVQSRRDGKMVMYAATDRGVALLETVMGAEAKS